MRKQNCRSHKALGAVMELFCFPKPKLSSMCGLSPALLPRGQSVMLQLQEGLRKLQREQGFEEVRTGSLAQAYLWHRSGHLKHFSSNMYAITNPKPAQGAERVSGEVDLVDSPAQTENQLERNREDNLSCEDFATSYLLKPMSCPLHLSLFFDNSVRVGSALPMRISEFGHVYRREVPSALYGLLRMREFTQDDGHILCRMSQAAAEVDTFLTACQRLYKGTGFRWRDVAFRLSTRPESSQGSDQEWAHAEGLLRSGLERLKLSFTMASGEGAFYGPKIDILLPDVDGRLWQTGTLQVDMFSPRAFGLEPAPRSDDPLCLLHRAMCGSLERFLGLVLEYTNGHLSPWLAATQVAVLSVGRVQTEEVEALGRRLRKAGIRVSIDTRPVHISRKLKLQLKYRTPEVWLLGATDQEKSTVTVRRSNGQHVALPVARALAGAKRRAKMPF
ncbi:uncharacterized protein LOC34617942 [Cyclospora cayetanensis]|uniref:threonine--tRNA ligase n=1 Tax=Cyclospora cayetanensis TaxID=88456 RepID=A0A6P6RV88_9EIME|nr:uncharacterized protein LOC34617942 [Cyclospora cayetanensis]